MNVHLFRSRDCEPEVLSDVSALLNSFPGILNFVEQPEVTHFTEFFHQPPPKPEFLTSFYNNKIDRPEKEDFENRFQKRPTLSWNQIFDKCSQLRQQHDIGNEEFVVLLTSYNNNLNWFSAGNPAGPKDHFVQTDDWDYFLGSDRRFPIAYQIASGVLKKLVFSSYQDLQDHWHEEPRGCMLDFCKEKKQISLKVRTGDICSDCLKLIHERGVSPAVVGQIFSIFDGIRTHMLFKNRFEISGNVPVLHILGRNKDLAFPELGMLRLHLNPLEKALYLFFLNHPEGVPISHLPDYKAEILELYASISPADSRETIEKRVEEMIDPVKNSCSEKISRIKRKVTDALGPGMASFFIISGANGTPKKIPFDRSLLVIQP